MQDYYANPHVRARMLEFLGGNRLGEASAVSITADDEWLRHSDSRPAADLSTCLERGWGISRSLEDRRLFLVDLDIEYVNFDYPAEPYVNPDRSFALQRPLVETIETLLAGYGIRPLHFLSGRGHHFVWGVLRGSPVFRRLVALGRVAEPRRRDRRHEFVDSREESETETAFLGLGMVMEYFSHRVLARAAGRSRIPLQPTEIVVGKGERGREIVSLDLSEYGDPLRIRLVRLPFSCYLKPMQQRDSLGSQVVEALPPLFVIAANGVPEQEGLLAMRDPALAAGLAARSHCLIPEESDGMARVVNGYARSSLARFHRRFYAEPIDPPEKWPDTYDRTPQEILPPCVREPLERPNDLLLKPALLQNLVRGLLAFGWHPRHIAGLIRSRYERDCGWGDRWEREDPAKRADFYVRLFTGLIVRGLDELVDFNCQSTKEKGLCSPAVCWENLESYKNTVLARMKHEGP